MKYKDKQGIFKDERTVQIEHKLGYEIAFFTIILLLLSILVKLVFWRLDWQACVPEIIIIFTLEIYAGIRSWQLGLDIRRSDTTSSSRRFRSRLATGIFLAASFLLVQILNGGSKEKLSFSQNPVLQFIFILVLIVIFSNKLDQLVNYFYRKRQIKLEKELEEN